MQRLPIRKALRALFGDEHYRVQRDGEIHVHEHGAWTSFGRVDDPRTIRRITDMLTAQQESP